MIRIAIVVTMFLILLAVVKYSEPRNKKTSTTLLSNVNAGPWSKDFSIFDFLVLENGHFTFPLIIGLFLFSLIALIFEQREDEKLKGKVGSK